MIATYPCPACGNEANLVGGCAGCGRAPDPEAAELLGLTTYIRELTAAAAAARDAYAAAVHELTGARRRRDELAARVRARTPAPARPGVPAMPAPAVAGRPPVGVDRPEASTRTVQNLLFVLGGLLLGAAAIVFTAVAWADVGFTGRAVVLGVITLLVLAVPPVARWRLRVRHRADRAAAGRARGGHEMALVQDLVPRWVPFGLGGMLLVALATRYERSRRDVGRLRTAVGRMR